MTTNTLLIIFLSTEYEALIWPSHWGSSEACCVPLSPISSVPEIWPTKLNSEPLMSHAKETMFLQMGAGLSVPQYGDVQGAEGAATAALTHSFRILCFDTHCKHSLQETLAIADKLCGKNLHYICTGTTRHVYSEMCVHIYTDIYTRVQIHHGLNLLLSRAGAQSANTAARGLRNQD